MSEVQQGYNKAKQPETKKKKLGKFVLNHTMQVRDRVARIVSPELAEEARLALYDPSTGLPNRRAMQRRFEQLNDTNLPFAAIMVDIDDFKQTNTKVGHENADELLLQFAKKIRGTIRESDQITYVGETFRTGGDEFILLAPLFSHSENADELTPEQRLEALLKRLGTECCDGVSLIDLSGQSVVVSATYCGVLVDSGTSTDTNPHDILNNLSLKVTEMKKVKRGINA